MDDLDKIIVIFHGIDNKPFLSKFKFQKAVFLSILTFSKNKKEALEKLEDASFYPHKYGPYSEYVEEKRLDLERQGILKKIDKGLNVLSEAGLEVYSNLVARIGEKNLKLFAIRNIKEMINVPINDHILALLVYDIAEKYGYVLNSKIISELEKNRLKYAIILYKKAIVSRERAAELARMKLFEFSSMLMRLRNL